MQPAANLPVSPGDVLLGKYRVERILGQGGMGIVVQAHHVALNERVALKFLLPEYAAHPEASARFIREARAAVKIKSEHVARVSDVGTLEGGSPYMVMEYLEGADVAQELERGGPMNAADAADYVIQACDAIAEAHAHAIVHRDIKPANLFVTRRMDGSPLVKVLDFGISKVMDADVSDSLTRTTATMGSALYMSPEQLQQARSVDLRTDIYALGISLYEMLTRQQPFIADSFPQLCVAIAMGSPTPLRNLRPELPEAFTQVVEKAFARDRAQRYQTVAELVAALAPWAPPRSQPVVERILRASGATGATQLLTEDWRKSQSGVVGASTDLSAVRTQPQRQRAGLVVGLLLAGLAGLAVLVGGVLLFLHFRSASAAPAASAEAAQVASAPSAAPAAAPAPSASAAPAPSAPAASATETPSASASAPSHAAPSQPTKARKKVVPHWHPAPRRPSHRVSPPKPAVKSHTNTGLQDNGAMR